MKIYSFTGSHSTGKTTLLRKMKQDPQFTNWLFIDEITRNIARNGAAINEKGDDNTQQLIIDSHWDNMNFVSGCKGKILDRWALDGYVYTKYLHSLGRISDSTLERSYNQLMYLKNTLTGVFYIRPEFDIVSDGVRSEDAQFRKDIADLFEQCIMQFSIKVILLKGTVEQRYNTILSYMEITNGK